MTFAAVVVLTASWSASLQAEYSFSLALRSPAHLGKIRYSLCVSPELEYKKGQRVQGYPDAPPEL